MQVEIEKGLIPKKINTWDPRMFQMLNDFYESYEPTPKFDIMEELNVLEDAYTAYYACKVAKDTRGMDQAYVPVKTAWDAANILIKALPVKV